MASKRKAQAQCLVVMGVSGVGKTTTSEALAERLGWMLAEADEFHPQQNIDKMRAGIPLSDEDRAPWLEALRDWIAAQIAEGRSVVVTCSALKHRYRDVLREAGGPVRFVHLVAEPDVIAGRMSQRRGHFMPVSLLQSQLADLEPLTADESGMAVDASLPPGTIVADVVRTLDLPDSPSAS